MQLLREEDMQQLHKKLPNFYKDNPSSNLQRLLDRHGKKENVQAQTGSCADSRKGITQFWFA